MQRSQLSAFGDVRNQRRIAQVLHRLYLSQLRKSKPVEKAGTQSLRSEGSKRSQIAGLPVEPPIWAHRHPLCPSLISTGAFLFCQLRGAEMDRIKRTAIFVRAAAALTFALALSSCGGSSAGTTGSSAATPAATPATSTAAQSTTESATQDSQQRACMGWE